MLRQKLVNLKRLFLKTKLGKHYNILQCISFFFIMLSSNINSHYLIILNKKIGKYFNSDARYSINYNFINVFSIQCFDFKIEYNSQSKLYVEQKFRDYRTLKITRISIRKKSVTHDIVSNNINNHYCFFN